MDNQSSTKRPEGKRIRTVDYLSILPDDILAYMLSFMSTKEAIQTSVLAKKYRNLWTLSPALDFDFGDFLPSDKTLELDEETLAPYEGSFKKVVDDVIARRPALNLDSFKIVWEQENGNPNPATTWLNTVAALNPKFLSVHIYTENYEFEVPDSVFITESLRTLALHVAEAINPSDVNLPYLKKLILDNMPTDDEVLQKLLAGSPVLEDLVIDNCSMTNSEIGSEKLRRLVLNSLQEIIDPPEILLSLPSLVFLEMRSWASGKLRFRKLESLLGAQIHLEELSNVEPLFLTGLSNVITLELVLSVSCLKV